VNFVTFIEASSFLTLLLQPNNETAESITPLLSVVRVGSLPCLEVLIEVHDQLDEYVKACLLWFIFVTLMSWLNFLVDSYKSSKVLMHLQFSLVVSFFNLYFLSFFS
jgi:hypothetical protein